MISLVCKLAVISLATFFLATCFAEDASAQERRVRYVTNLASGHRHQVTQPKPYKYSSGTSGNSSKKASNSAAKPMASKSTATSNKAQPKPTNGKSPRIRSYKPVVVSPKDPQIGQVVPSSSNSRTSVGHYSPQRVIRSNGYTIPSRGRSCLPGG